MSTGADLRMPQCLHRTAASLKAMKPNFRCPSASDRKCPQVTWREVGVACCYLVLAAVAVVVTYELVETMRFSLQHPVRSANYRRVEEYDAPGEAGAGQGRAGQGRAGQGRAGQGRAGQGRAGAGQSGAG